MPCLDDYYNLIDDPTGMYKLVMKIHKLGKGGIIDNMGYLHTRERIMVQFLSICSVSFFIVIDHLNQERV